VNQHEVRNLLFQHGSRLLELRFNQAGSDLIVEAVESGSDLAAFFAIECALQLANHKEGMVDFPRTRLNVISMHSGERTAQIVDALLVQKNNQLQRPGAPSRCLAI